MRAGDKAPIYSGSWIGQDGKEWRNVKYWLGDGWSASFLQYKDVSGEWFGY